MALGNFRSNEGTQTGIIVDTIGTSVMAIQKVDISPLGADGTVWNGNVGVTSGTINVSTISTLPNLPQGSINVTAGTIATLGTMGTLGLVNTVTTVSNLTNGSLNVTAGTIATLGTMGTLGLVNTVTTVSNLTNGSIKVTAGTEIVTSGSVNVVAGTVNTGTINAGTINAATITGGTLQNLNFGTIAISDGTTKANIMASGVSNGSAAQNAQLVAGGYAEFSGSATAGTVDIVASTDVSAYRWFSIQLVGTWVGTANLQFSNDNSTFVTGGGAAITNSANSQSTLLSSNNIYHGPITGRYLRLRTGAFTSGTMQAVVELYNSPLQLHTYGITATQSGAWNVTGTVATGSIAVTAGTVSAGTINTGTINAGTLNIGTVIGTSMTLTGTTAAGTADIITGTDVSGYKWISIQSDNNFVGTAQFQVSNDNITYAAAPVFGILAVANNGNLNFAQNSQVNAPITTRYIKVRAGAFTSGTATITAFLSTIPSQLTGNDVRVAAGTLGVVTVGTVTSGTITALGAGTITAGTINTGTINTGTINAATANLQPFPATQMLSAATTGTVATGTLVAAIGAGTGIYVQSADLIVGSGTLDLCLSFGTVTTGAQVVNRGLYVAGGGIAKSFTYPSYYGTANSPLTYQIVAGAGTAYWNVTYATKGTP